MATAFPRVNHTKCHFPTSRQLYTLSFSLSLFHSPRMCLLFHSHLSLSLIPFLFYLSQSLSIMTQCNTLHESQSHSISNLKTALYALSVIGLVLPFILIPLSIFLYLLARRYENSLSTFAHSSARQLATMMNLQSANQLQARVPANKRTAAGRPS